MVHRIVLLCLVLLASFSAQAAEMEKKELLPVPVVAIVDVQRLMQEALAAKSVQKQLEAHRAKFQAEISVEEKGLRTAESELARDKEKLSADTYAEKEQKLRQRFLSVERHVQSRRKALDQAFTDSMNVVRKNVLDIVGVLAKERGANLVVVKQQALWSDPALELTEDVLLRLNKALPDVSVTLSEVKTEEKDNP